MVLYKELARYWPIISPPDHYTAEGEIWGNAIRSRTTVEHPTALDLGCGGGHSLAPLTDYLTATAVDISEEMLELSKKLNPGVDHFIGDMRTLRLGKVFDVVLVNDAVGYMTTMDDLEALFETAKAHLGSGGLLVLGPDYFRETFVDNHFNCFQRVGGGIVLNMAEFYFDPDPDDTSFECVFNLIIREGADVKTYFDRHKFGLFSYNQWKQALESKGFNVEFVDYLTHGKDKPAKLVIGTLK